MIKSQFLERDGVFFGDILAVELVEIARDPHAKTAKDKEVPEDNASRFNYLTVWKLQNMVATCSVRKEANI